MKVFTYCSYCANCEYYRYMYFWTLAIVTHRRRGLSTWVVVVRLHAGRLECVRGRSVVRRTDSAGCDGRNNGWNNRRFQKHAKRWRAHVGSGRTDEGQLSRRRRRSRGCRTETEFLCHCTRDTDFLSSCKSEISIQYYIPPIIFTLKHCWAYITVSFDVLREARVDFEHFRYENIVGDVGEVQHWIHVRILDEVLSRLKLEEKLSSAVHESIQFIHSLFGFAHLK